MPFDEVQPEDPMELVGIGLPCDEREMVLSVVDEFVRMGHGPDEVRALFASPRYAMTHAVWKTRGEAWVQQCIDEVFRRWAGQ